MPSKTSSNPATLYHGFERYGALSGDVTFTCLERPRAYRCPLRCARHPGIGGRLPQGISNET